MIFHSAANASRPGTIVCNMGAHGIGDGLQGLLAVCGLKQDCPHAKVVYKVGPKAIPFVSLFAGPDVVVRGSYDYNGSKRFKGTDRQVNRRYFLELKSRSEECRWERYRVNIGASRCILPALYDEAAVRAHGVGHEGVIVLCPFSSGIDREWSVPHWLELERQLIASGRKTVVLDNQPDRTRRFRSPKGVSLSAASLAGLMLVAGCVVGQDSGLSHLAGILGTPVVVLTGPTNGEKIYKVYPTARWLAGVLPCGGCYWQKPFAESICRPKCPNLQTIWPDQVFEAITNCTRDQ